MLIPSQTIFATQLFNADEVSKTVKKYMISTIVVSLDTYLIASILVWSADKIGRWYRLISGHVVSAWTDLVLVNDNRSHTVSRK